ncbi:uncharacterized protein N7479_005176 [Penicillium vulpinum]|uniref:Uncharacterized protein n=1 Tax=Penicillium vulpinum TaxID=29845 RepID=A0A1V6REV1_9EURO|nr:uncharacterized protein N7479_005176 [Penicillium vulpinum]KAJ5958026.1 hypothetical protein N7479_005176 [Penicillium vulpinum]OQE00321.1 hypothetical protein PENVUL_c054G08119 [Penicillium vulpinum]
MDLQALRLYFRGLALLAALLLWGISVWNGTVKALLLAVYHGWLTDDIPLQTKYTGIPLVDLPIALLVAFFFYGTNGHTSGYQYFLLDAYSTLQSAFIWLYVESFRVDTKPRWIAQPVIFGFLWQAFGAAISLPLYYALHVEWLLQARATGEVRIRGAVVIPIGFLLGAVVPVVIGMLPTWTGAASRSAIEHQYILAVWQLDPMWVSWIQLGLGAVVSRLWRTGEMTQQQSYLWVRGSYLLAAASSTVGHAYVILKALSDEKMSLWHMYVPSGLSGPSGTDGILVRGPWLFLQYDLIIIALSSLSWAFVLICHAFDKHRFVSRAKVGLLLLAGAITIGPGGTVSLALFVREARLHQSRAKKYS